MRAETGAPQGEERVEGPAAGSMPSVYTPGEHEERIRRRWESAHAFSADPGRVLSGEAPPYSIVIPPPNVTAALHLGHALNNTLQDILVRSKRMQGCETLWMPGTDHAGIATQTVVERRLLEEEGRRRTDYEREEFVSRVQAWKDEYEERITDQLKRMGCSCDWERQRFTMDPICARAVREAFFRLFKDGLIYRGKRLVNWDPVTQTALADDEVEMREVEGRFYYLRYPLCDEQGRAATATLPSGETIESVTVATTRPETYLGDTAVAVNPADPRAEAVRGLRCRLPFVDRTIPIIEDDYVVRPAEDPEAPGVDVKAKFATGFLKVTPAHDPNDWEIGRRHALDAINVMAPDASISDRHGWEDVGEAGRFVGMDRFAAREAVVEGFREAGLLEDVRPHTHSVGHSYRSHAPIEPYLSDQWYVKVTDERLAGAAQRALAPEQRTTKTHPAQGTVEGDGEVHFFPDRYAKTYESWHDNIRDWCISRQLWWGHQIPVWSRPLEGGGDRTGFESRETSSVATARSETHVHVCPREDDPRLIGDLEGAGFVRDPDVLDTWFSSALWPISTMGWPEPSQDDALEGLLEAFNPTSVLCTAREIITLWVSRMVMFNRHFMNGRVPFRDVYIHAMIQDGEGRKMSKSLGNGVDPLDIIHSHGADAMRFALAQLATQTQDVRMPVEVDPETGRNTSPKFDIGKRFCNKLWNASRFTMMMLDKSEGAPANHEVTLSECSLMDRWMLSRIAEAGQKIEAAMAEYRFNVYADVVYDLAWNEFCDWYLEAIKPSVRTSAATQAVLRAALGTIIRLIHPICPFITEAIWERLRHYETPHAPGLKRDGVALLCQASWNEVSPDLRDPNAERVFERLRGLVTAIRDVRAQQQVSPSRALTLHAPGDVAEELHLVHDEIRTLARLERIDTDAPEGLSTPFTFEGCELRLSGLRDEKAGGAEEEKARLARQIEDLDQSIGVLEKRLSNPGYVEKAPSHLVEQTRAELDARKSERETVRRSLERLG